MTLLTTAGYLALLCAAYFAAAFAWIWANREDEG
jgi:hypothetical protein